MELVLLNPRLDAARALQLGLINAVYSTQTFDDEVRRTVQAVVDGPTEAFAVAKGLLNHAAGMDRLDVHLDRELDSLTRIADGAEFAEGLDGFFAKRSPIFPRK
jgi:2-(1,2-epoxy-1,2-dihydrophenyl)acetyl-CoA isomerase